MLFLSLRNIFYGLNKSIFFPIKPIIQQNPHFFQNKKNFHTTVDFNKEHIISNSK